MENIAKVQNIQSLIKLFEQYFPSDYERYGSRQTKLRMRLEDFFQTISQCYAATQTTSTKASHFFRSTGAQTKFREINNLTEDQMADHILSTAVFRTIVKTYWPPDAPGLTYDYWMSVKTVLNQCWNFQALSNKENLRKGAVEGRLIELLEARDIDSIKRNKEVMALIKLIRDSIEKEEKTWRQSKLVVETLQVFFRDFGLTINLNGNPDNRCGCGLCEFVRQASARWRKKYFILYQIPRNDIEIFTKVNLDVFQDLLKKVWPTNPALVDKYYNGSVSRGIEDIWSFIRMYEEMVPQIETDPNKADTHTKMIARQIRSTMMAYIVKKIKRKNLKEATVLERINSFIDYCPEDVKQVLADYTSKKITKEELLNLLR